MPDLLPPESNVPSARRQRRGWERLRGGVSGRWRHLATGWIVKRCGHPTALWPYCATPPGDAGALLIHSNGKAFQTLLLAQEAAEEAIATGYHRIGQVYAGSDLIMTMASAAAYLAAYRKNQEKSGF